MSEPPFALSPISARPAGNTEADYDAICHAFMETARGRWFLQEYAKRNRNADTQMVLSAVERIETVLAEQKAENQKPAAPARDEIFLAFAREKIREAREAIVSAALDNAEASPLAPIRMAAAAIRDVSWTLRECDGDTRVCDLLDAQAAAIGEACEKISVSGVNGKLLALMDEMAAALQANDAGNAKAEPESAAERPAPPEPAATPHLSAAVEAAVADAVAQASAETAEPLAAATQDSETAVEIVAVEMAAVEAATTEPLEAETALFEGAPAPVAELAAEPPKAATLGDALISHNIMPPSEPRVAPVAAGADPLAAIRRMSQAEKLAFFA